MPDNQVCAERIIRGVLNILCVTKLGPRRFIFTYTKVNTNSFPIILRYTSTQRFDFAVRRADTGREVWRWSFNRVFLPQVNQIRLAPGESTSQSVEWPAVNNNGNPVPSGRYILRGENLATVRRVGEGDVDVIPATAAMEKMQVEAEFEHSTGMSSGSQAKVIASSSQSADSVHVVKPGDSLWKIAQKYGTTVNQLQSLNGLADPSKLNVGQKIKVR